MSANDEDTADSETVDRLLKQTSKKQRPKSILRSPSAAAIDQPPAANDTAPSALREASSSRGRSSTRLRQRSNTPTPGTSRIQSPSPTPQTTTQGKRKKRSESTASGASSTRRRSHSAVQLPLDDSEVVRELDCCVPSGCTDVYTAQARTQMASHPYEC